MKTSWENTKTCDTEAREGYLNVIQKATVDSMNLICSRYENDEAKCKKFVSEAPKKKNKNLRPTPISYIFDIFESI